MPLKIIKGPPNSGRTEQIRQAYIDLLPKNPVLVVPGVDDIYGWERRLTEGSNAVVGGQILHFKDLYGEILSLGKEARPEIATGIQRLHLVRQALDSRWKTIAERVRDQPGLAESVLELIDDFRAETLDPETLADRIERNELRHLTHLADVYREYIRLLTGEVGDRRDGGGSGRRNPLTDGPNEARVAIERVEQLWRSRPVMIVGFDELTRQQLELVRRLAFEVGTEVTISVTHEPDNPALALTERLVADLNGLGPEREVTTVTTRREDAPRPHDPLLLEVEKRFMRPLRESDRPLEATDALTVMRSTGARNEAEAIALEVARLVSNDVPPDRIGIAVEVPAQNGRVLRDTLDRFRIPASLEAETDAGSTVTGQALLNLLKAIGPSDSVDALLAFLRSPAGLKPDLVDHLERWSRVDGIESARVAVEHLNGRLRQPAPPPWEVLAASIENRQPIAGPAAEITAKIGLAVLAADPAPVPSASTMIETRTVSAIARTCREIEGLYDPVDQTAAIIEALESGLVTVWAVPGNGTVRIASPYSMRAKRFEYLFCASLQESGLTDPDRAGPFLSVAERGALGMSGYRDPEIQQRYLFYSSLSVPTRRLWLSCRTSDETGKAEHPSPLIAAVEELFEIDGDGKPTVKTGGRTGSEITFQPADAPTGDELARSLAVLGESGEPVLAGLDVASGTAGKVRTRLAEAIEAESRTRCLGSISEPVVRALTNSGTLKSYPKFAATEIEAYSGCPYRWFIERRLNPQPFEPDPDYLTTGSLIHSVLEDLYLNHRPDIPRQNTLAAWCGEVPALVDRHASSRRIGLGSSSPGHRAIRSRVIQLIVAHLERESRRNLLEFRPDRFELSFGTRHAKTGSLRIGGWALKGKIDRIDRSDDRAQAVVIDYKTGSVKDLGHEKSRKKRKLQLQLYLRAVEQKLGVIPMAGIYVPLRADGEKARGAFAEGVAEEMKDRGVSKDDSVESLNEFIEDGIRTADTVVESMLNGVLEHDPATCPDHLSHVAVQDRLEWKPDTELPGVAG